MSSTTNLRKFGIELVGLVPWGSHLCQFYESKQDLIDVLVGYFAEGLRNNEFCMWITSPPLETVEAKGALEKAVPDLNNYLQKGQIEIVSYKEWYLFGGKFDVPRVLQSLIQKENSALLNGFEGLRLSGNIRWVENRMWKSFVEYEERVNAVINKFKMLSLCTYFLQDTSGAQMLEVLRNHNGTLLKQGKKWVLVEDATERKKNEQALLQAKTDWERTFDSVPDLIAILDRHHKIVRVNQAMARQLGTTPKECIGLHCFECVHGTDVPPEFCPHTKSIQDNKEHIAEIYEPRLGGDFLVSTTPLNDSKGLFYGSVHVARNISDIKKAEDSLRESEQRWSTTLSSIGDAVIATDVDGKVTFMNNVAEKLTGWTLKEAIQKPLEKIFNLINEYTRKEVESPVKLVLKEGIIVGLANHTILLRKDGSEVPIDDSGAPIKDKNGIIKGVVLVFRDITERKKTEETLRESEVKFRTVANFIYDWEYWLAPDGSLAYVSRSCERITGYKADEFKENPDLLNDIIYPDDKHLFVSHYVLTKNDEAHEIDFRIITRNGETRWLTHTCQPVFGDKGKWLGRRISNRDITERKKAEEAVIKSEEQYRSLFSNMSSGFAYCKMIFDQEGAPIDFTYLEINNMFEKITGLKKDLVIGRKVTEAIPGIKEATPELFATYGRVAQTEKSEKFEINFTPLNIWLSVSVYSPEKGYFAAVFENITERKTSEEALKKQAALIDLSPDGIIVKKLDGTITFWSEGAEKLYGWTKEEAIGKKADDLLKTVFTVDPDKIIDDLKQVGKWSGELTHLARDGRKVMVQSLWSATAAQQKITEILESNVDITERKKASEALRHSNEKLRLISDITSQLLSTNKPQSLIQELCLEVMQFLNCDVFFNFLVDEEKQRLHLNAFAGVTSEVARGIEWLDFGESVCGCVAKEGKRIVCENIPETDDFRAALVRSFGVKAYAAHPIFSQGKIIGTLSFGSKQKQAFTEDELSLMKTVADQVSVAMERKKAEDIARRNEALSVASKYARSLIEASLDPLVTISIEGKITDVNQATEIVTGCSRQELIGSDFSNYFTEPEEARKGYQKVLTDGFVKDYPLVIRHVSGKITDVLYNATLFRNEAGKVQGVFAAARDITKRKAMENELRETLQKLKQSNAELEQFAYIASHDLQEPLRMVGSYVQLLQRRYQGKLDAEADEFIAYAVDGANRMRGLIDDLLTYSRVGRLGKPFEPTNIESTLEIALKNLQASITENNASVTHDELPIIDADGGQLVQLFQNLIGNAIKFHGKEPPRVHISAIDKGKEYQFSVSDNGIGIEPQYFDRLFKIFQRLYTRDEYPGSGIGLAVCKKIVERHGGYIWIESELGKGSTIFFTLSKRKSSEKNE